MSEQMIENMVVCEIRGKMSYAGPGMWGYDAEARVEDHKGENRVYVHVNDYEIRHYTVSKTSIYDYMTGKAEEPHAVFDEEYMKLSDAKESKYYKVFDTLTKVITRMEKGLK